MPNKNNEEAVIITFEGRAGSRKGSLAKYIQHLLSTKDDRDKYIKSNYIEEPTALIISVSDLINFFK